MIDDKKKDTRGIHNDDNHLESSIYFHPSNIDNGYDDCAETSKEIQKETKNMIIKTDIPLKFH